MQVAHVGRREGPTRTTRTEAEGGLSHPAEVKRRKMESQLFGEVVWDHIHFDRVAVPRVKHLMILQGVPLSHMFHERGLLLLGCKMAALWEAPFYLYDVHLGGIVTVNGDPNVQIDTRVGIDLLRQIHLDPSDH